MHKTKLHWELVRPFTLLPPALGVVSGALCATASKSQLSQSGTLNVLSERWGFIVLGALAASTLNAGSNAINQYTDYEIDRINKPSRPLPSGRLSRGEGLRVSLLLLLIGLAMAFFVAPNGRHDYFLLAACGLACTLAYSVEPLRLKKHLALANVCIALPRGCLLLVAGWACIGPVWSEVQAWYLGVMVMLFLIGAASTKDFSDMEGDRLGGCATLPIRFGARKAAWIISPFLMLPWLLLPLGSFGSGRLLQGNPCLLGTLGILLFCYGGFVDYLLLRDPEELTRAENHPSWKHMYLMMMLAQIGLAAAYVLG